MKMSEIMDTLTLKGPTYATPAAGGIIYSLNVLFFLFWQDRTDSLLQISLFRQVWVVTNYFNIDAKFLF